LAALSVHSNSRIRRACDRVEDILLASAGPREFHDRLERLARSLHSIPGFNHPLYPKGDPRAKRLIEISRELSTEGDGGGFFPFGQLLDEMLDREKATPSVEVALVILCRVLHLPYRSAGAIFAIARCGGLVAHLIEQRLAGIMLRPRARYFS
jgi:citrate synthase